LLPVLQRSADPAGVRDRAPPGQRLGRRRNPCSERLDGHPFTDPVGAHSNFVDGDSAQHLLECNGRRHHDLRPGAAQTGDGPSTVDRHATEQFAKSVELPSAERVAVDLRMELHPAETVVLDDVRQDLASPIER
ncbi:MAG: hypothetical protein L3K07_04000, partial [Thermoplasmata archaeon]|nr:hypothetical protein [Thermoplasmata archaeon]